MSVITPDQVPEVMVEAAAKAVHEHGRVDFPNDPPWEELSEVDRDTYRKAERLALAAALSECVDIRDSIGVRVRLAEDHTFERWDDDDFLTRARLMLAAQDGQRQGQDVTLVRRWVFTSPAEPVPDGEQ